MPNPASVATMRVNHDTPVSWVAAVSFNMEHAVTLLAIGRHEWPDETQPRTDRPVVFYLYRKGEPCPHVVRPPAGFRRIAPR